MTVARRMPNPQRPPLVESARAVRLRPSVALLVRQREQASLWVLRALLVQRLLEEPFEQRLERKKARLYRTMRPVPIDSGKDEVS